MAKKPKAPKMQNPKAKMKQLEKIKDQIEIAQTQLAEETVTASVGGGTVRVVITGDQRCHSVEIDPTILEDTDVEMLQDLLLAAFNSALEQSREMAAERLGPLAGGLPI